MNAFNQLVVTFDILYHFIYLKKHNDNKSTRILAPLDISLTKKIPTNFRWMKRIQKKYHRKFNSKTRQMRIWTYSKNWTTKLKWIKWTGIFLRRCCFRSMAVRSLAWCWFSFEHTHTHSTFTCAFKFELVLRSSGAPSEHWIHFCLYARTSRKWSGRGEFNECGEFVAAWRFASQSFVYLCMALLVQPNSSTHWGIGKLAKRQWPNRNSAYTQFRLTHWFYS